MSLQTRSGRWEVRPSFRNPAFLARLENPEQLLAPPAQPLRTDSRSRPTFLARTIFPEYPETSVVVKRYYRRGLIRSLKNLIRPAGALRALKTARYLEELRIPTARPIAAGQLRCHGLPGESYFLSDEIVPFLSLRQLRRTQPPPFPTEVVLGALGKLIAQLHNAGLSHTDPTLSNFLARTNPFELLVIDVDGLRRLPAITPQMVLADLRRLFRRIAILKSEYDFFIHSYRGQRSAGPDVRELLKQI